MTVDFATAASQNVPEPWHFGRILGSASALFVSDLQDANKKLLFFCLLLLEVRLHNSSQIKKAIKKS
jgi:hypothetical protein